MQIDLAGKLILVTAGTSALGAALVKASLAEGAKVYFTYFENEPEARSLEAAGAVGVRADLRQAAEIERIKDAVKSAGVPLDGLVNNAGIVRDHTLGNLTDEEFDEVVAVDLSAAFLLTKRLLPLLYKSAGGKIVNVISRVGLQGGFGEANYAAAKAGLAAFTKTLAWETGRRGICVNAVAPGFLLSRMTKDLSPEVFERQKNESCLSRLGDVEEAARFIVFLLSDRLRSVSGQIFHVDSRKTRLF
jgi:3-oxoacyl-[acyl-carrier protein] reductase